MFVARDIALQVIEEIRGPLERMGKQDRALADQARRAVTSIVLNLEEGNQRKGGDREHLFRVAAGSLAEVRAAIHIAISWRYIEPPTSLLAVLDRLAALLYGLTRASRQSMASSRSTRTRVGSKLLAST